MDVFRSIKIRILRDFQPVFTFMVDAFPVCKDVQSAVGQGEKHGYNHGDVLFYMANHFFFTVSSTNYRNGILVYSIGWLFNAL